MAGRTERPVCGHGNTRLKGPARGLKLSFVPFCHFSFAHAERHSPFTGGSEEALNGPGSQTLVLQVPDLYISSILSKTAMEPVNVYDTEVSGNQNSETLKIIRIDQEYVWFMEDGHIPQRVGTGLGGLFLPLAVGSFLGPRGSRPLYNEVINQVHVQLENHASLRLSKSLLNVKIVVVVVGLICRGPLHIGCSPIRRENKRLVGTAHVRLGAAYWDVLLAASSEGVSSVGGRPETAPSFCGPVGSLMVGETVHCYPVVIA